MPKTPSTPKPEARYFVSYTREDGQLPTGFLKRIKPLLEISKQYSFKVWRDTEILPGEDWDTEIHTAMEECQVALLLLSPSYFTRPYIVGEELPRLLKPDKVIIPVLIRPINLKLQETRGLDMLQIFSLQSGKGGMAFSECNTAKQKDEFAMKLYEQIEARLKKIVSVTKKKKSTLGLVVQNKKNSPSTNQLHTNNSTTTKPASNNKSNTAKKCFPSAGNKSSRKGKNLGISSLEKLFPNCFKQVQSLSADPELSGFLNEVGEGNFVDWFKANGTLKTINSITLKIPDTRTIQNKAKLKSLLAAMAPFYVPDNTADVFLLDAFVIEGRKQLGITLDSPKGKFKGGILRICKNTDEAADAIMRAALYDQPCAWDESGSTSNTIPSAKKRFSLDVPSRGTIEGEHIASIQQRIIEFTRAPDYRTAMETLRGWLEQGEPLTTICDHKIISLIKKLPTAPDGTLQDFGLFLSKYKDTHSGMRPLIVALEGVFKSI